MSNKKYDIYERIFKFIVMVVKLVKFLPRTEENLVIVKQILRSVTSMGKLPIGRWCFDQERFLALLYNSQERS